MINYGANVNIQEVSVIIKKIILCLVLFSCFGFAEKLSVLNDESTAKVYLNGVYIGIGNVSNFEVEPGNYTITVKQDDETVFVEDIYLYPGESRVVNTNRFVSTPKSNVANIGAKKLEQKRLKKSTKGKIGVGGKFGGFANGLSAKYAFTDKWSAQMIGWSSETYNSFQGRFLYELGSNLVAKDHVIFLYAGFGAGNADGDQWLSSNSSKHNFVEGFLGIEYPNNYGYSSIEVSYISDNETNDSDETSESNGFVILGSHHYYFN